MKYTIKSFAISILIYSFLMSCGNSTSEKSVAKADSIKSPQVEKKVEPVVVKEPIELAAGIYVLEKTTEDPQYVDKKVEITFVGKDQIKVNKDTYEYGQEKEGAKVIFKFGEVSEDTEDWLGGGNIEVLNGKPKLTIFSGTEANFESIYKKVE